MTAVLLVLAVVQQPADTAGRAGRPCQVTIDSVGNYGRQVEVGPGETNFFAGGGVRAHCRGTASTLAADSVAWYGGPGRFDMVGRVQIRDSALALDANLASYYLRQERLEAHYNVLAVNHRNGSVLRGPNLTYYRAAEGIRDTVEIYATSRPTIEYRAASDSGGGEPYVIVADRVRFKGKDRMWGAGKVTIDRSDLAARADSMYIDETAGAGVLVGKPRVEGKVGRPYTLVGTRIEMGLARREIRLVKALGKGEATGDDWRLTADTIHLAIERRKLQQAFAWGDSSRPHAISSRYTIQADSLALDVPDEVLTEARAFGRAFSTTARDSAAAAPNLDWITGDTLTAHFVQEADSTGEQSPRLRQLVAGGSARAFTHLYDERDPSAPPSLNYSRGTRIAVALNGERIGRVLVSGQADGLHLEALPPAPAAPDTARGSSPS